MGKRTSYSFRNAFQNRHNATARTITLKKRRENRHIILPNRAQDSSPPVNLSQVRSRLKAITREMQPNPVRIAVPIYFDINNPYFSVEVVDMSCAEDSIVSVEN